MILPWAITWLRRAVVVAFIAIAAIVFVRAYQVCSREPEGGRLMRESLLADLPPWFSQPLDPDIWNRARRELIKRAEAVASDPNATAEDCMGMALLLAGMGTRANPTADIAGRFAWGCELPGVDWNSFGELDMVALNLARKLAARATELDPTQIDWWRLRALFSTAERPDYVPSEIHTDGLEDGLAHDPDNGLYEYLLGAKKMNEAFGQKELSQGPVYFVANPELFEAGKKQFEAAAQKSKLLFGEGSTGCAAQMLDKLEAPIEMKMIWSQPAPFENISMNCFTVITNPISDGKLSDFSNAEETQFKQWLLNNSTTMKQIELASPTLWLWSARRISAAVGNMPAWTNYVTRQAFLQQETEAEASQNALAFAGVASGAMAVMLLLVTLGCWCVSRFIRKPSESTVAASLFVTPLLFAALFAVTFVLLGLGGTYAPDFALYPKSVIAAGVVSVAAILALVAWLTWFTVRRSKLPQAERGRLFQFVRLLLVIVLSLAFIIALFTAIDPKFREVAAGFVKKFPGNVLPQHGIDFGILHSIGLDWRPNFLQAVMEWGHSRGAFWTIGLTVAALIAWRWRRSAALVDKQERAANALRFASKSTIWLAALLFVLSVAIASQAVVDRTQRFERDRARLADYAWLGKIAVEQEQRPKLKPLTP